MARPGVFMVILESYLGLVVVGGAIGLATLEETGG